MRIQAWPSRPLTYLGTLELHKYLPIFPRHQDSTDHDILVQRNARNNNHHQRPTRESARSGTYLLLPAHESKVTQTCGKIQCLDFDRLSEWHTDFIVSTTVTRPGTDSNNTLIRGLEAVPGDSLAILSGGFVGLAKVQVGGFRGFASPLAVHELTSRQENSPEVFSYEYTGRKLGLDATRAFHFSPEPSSCEGEESGRTLFRHFASWQGYAAVMFMAWSPICAHVKGLFEGFDDDLKREAEKKRD